MTPRHLTTRAAGLALALLLPAAGIAAATTVPDEAVDDAAAAGDLAVAEFPITVSHAFGETTITEQPVRVATVQWANHEVPLALGVVPVGMAAANFGDDDGDGMLPWVAEKLEELGADVPVLFDETDGIDFEAVADTQPDVILAAYSGLTQDDYELLSEIAPTIPYPEAPWATAWRDMIIFNSVPLGLGAQGEALIADIEQQMADSVARYPQLAGKSVMFMGHVDVTDLSEVGFYTTADTRVQFFADLGLEMPASIAELSATTEGFYLTNSTEQIDVFDDVDIIVSYGDAEGTMLANLQADPLMSLVPAISRGSVVFLPGSTPLSTAANPTPLAISWVLDDYVSLLAEAADLVDAAPAE